MMVVGFFIGGIATFHHSHLTKMIMFVRTKFLSIVSVIRTYRIFHCFLFLLPIVLFRFYYCRIMATSYSLVSTKCVMVSLLGSALLDGIVSKLFKRKISTRKNNYCYLLISKSLSSPKGYRLISVCYFSSGIYFFRLWILLLLAR